MVVINASHLIASLAVFAAADVGIAARPIRLSGQDSPAPAARMQRVMLRSSPPPLPVGVKVDAGVRFRRPLSRRALRRANGSRRSANTNDSIQPREHGLKHVHEHIHEHGRGHRHGGHNSHHYKDGDLEYELKHHSKHWAQHHGLARRDQTGSTSSKEFKEPHRHHSHSRSGPLPLRFNGPGSVTLGRRQELEARRSGGHHHGSSHDHVHVHEHDHSGHKHGYHHGASLKLDSEHVHVHTHAHRSAVQDADLIPSSPSSRSAQHIFALTPPLAASSSRLDRRPAHFARRGLLGSIVKPLLAPLNAIPGFITISDLLFGDDNIIKTVTSLVLHAEPHTNGSATPAATTVPSAYSYSLMASKDERTQVFLWPFKDGQSLVTNNAATNETVVRLAIPLLNVTSGDPMLMCATFDLTPPSTLQLEACSNSSDATVGDSVTAGKSQRFSYALNSGVLSPLYAKEFAGSLQDVQSEGTGSGSGNTTDSSSTGVPSRRGDDAPCDGATRHQLSANSTDDLSSPSSSSSSSSSPPSNSTSNRKTHSQVTLLFQPVGASPKSFAAVTNSMTNDGSGDDSTSQDDDSAANDEDGSSSLSDDSADVGSITGDSGSTDDGGSTDNGDMSDSSGSNSSSAPLQEAVEDAVDQSSATVTASSSPTPDASSMPVAGNASSSSSISSPVPSTTPAK